MLERPINEKSIRAVGIYISGVACRKARQRGLDIIVADIKKGFCLRKGLFDVAVCSEVLEHTVEPERILEALKKAARKVYVSIPNIAYYPHRLRLPSGNCPVQYVFHPAEHLRFWSVSDFTGFVRKFDYNVERVKPSNGFPLLYRL